MQTRPLRAACAGLLAMAAFATHAEDAGKDPPIEREPELSVSEIPGVPASLAGKGYRIGASVPVRGYNGQFTVRTDHGTLVADGTIVLRRRIAEVPAVAELARLSTTEVFVDALGDSAARSAKAIGRAVSNPVDTVKAAPAGLGRFFDKVGGDDDDASSDAGVGETTKEALGVNAAKRRLAKQVGVDPYTSNPLLAERLDTLANAAFAGGVSLDVALAVSTAGVATALSATKTISNLAWDLPPEDVRTRNDDALAKLGVSPASRRALLANRFFTPTIALAFVEASGALGTTKGLDAFAALAARSRSEAEARFYVTQLILAKRYADLGDRIESVQAPGKVGVFRTARGTAFVPAALDYLSWTEGVARFARTPHAGADRKVLWLTGRASPNAKAGLAAQGWNLRESATFE